MPAYVIIDFLGLDPARYAEYLEGGTPVAAQYGGRFLARGGRIEVLEGSWDPKRLVVIEFPDRAAASRWYRSPEYQSLRAIRAGAADFRCAVVEGVGA